MGMGQCVPPVGTFGSDVALVIVIIRRMGSDGHWPVMTWRLGCVGSDVGRWVIIIVR